MQKTLCIIVLATAQTLYSETPSMDSHMLAQQHNQLATAHFQPAPITAPTNLPALQTMQSMDSKFMVHPDHARQHAQLINEAYSAGYMKGYQSGMTDTGKYLQSALNGMAQALNTTAKATK